MGCHFLLQGIFLTQGSNLGLSALQADALPSEPPGKPLLYAAAAVYATCLQLRERVKANVAKCLTVGELSCRLHGSGSEMAQSCLTFCDHMDCSIPGSSIYGIFQARVLEWVATSLSRGSSRTRDRTQYPTLEADTLTSEPPGKPKLSCFYLYYQTH